MNKNQPVSPVPFELIPHTADIKIRAYGTTLKELFSNALRGMFSSVRPRIIESAPLKDRSITLQAPARDILLIDFLSECLYLSDFHNEAYLDVTIHAISDTKIHATLHGIPIDGFEVVEIKAVTYHDFSIKEKNGQLEATIVFDI